MNSCHYRRALPRMLYLSWECLSCESGCRNPIGKSLRKKFRKSLPIIFPSNIGSQDAVWVPADVEKGHLQQIGIFLRTDVHLHVRRKAVQGRSQDDSRQASLLRYTGNIERIAKHRAHPAHQFHRIFRSQNHQKQIEHPTPWLWL